MDDEVGQIDIVTTSTEVPIGFGSLEHVDAGISYHGDFYSEAGFTLNEIGSGQFATRGTLHPTFSGSTALYSATPAGGIVTLTKDDGAAFAIKSIDLAGLNNDNPQTVTFTGQLSGGGTIMQSFELDGSEFMNQKTFEFDPSFASVTSVSFEQTAPYYQFDNIVLSPVGVREDVATAYITTELTLMGDGTGPLAVGDGITLAANVVDGLAVGLDAATAGVDFTFATQAVTFDPGSVSGDQDTVSLTIVDDSLVEGDEKINFELPSSKGDVHSRGMNFFMICRSGIAPLLVKHSATVVTSTR